MPVGRPSGAAMRGQVRLREVRVNVNCGCHLLRGSNVGMRVDENGEM